MLWKKMTEITTAKFKCGYCGSSVASDKGWEGVSGELETWCIRICPNCEKPTFFDGSENQTPGVAYGNEVASITRDEVNSMYEEARRCLSVNAFNASVMCCRKLLMNIAVDQGADKNKNFVFYVNYIVDKFLPQAKSWIDHIRDKGNEANHEIDLMTKEDAEQIIKFSEMLLKVIFEYPASVKPKDTIEPK